MSITNMPSINPATSLAVMQAAQEGGNAAGKTLLDSKKMKEIDNAAQDFEAVFATEMVKPMFDSVKTDSMFGGGHAEDVFKSMLVQEYGKIIAKSDGLGLSGQIKEQMIKMQEQADNAQNKATP